MTEGSEARRLVKRLVRRPVMRRPFTTSTEMLASALCRPVSDSSPAGPSGVAEPPGRARHPGNVRRALEGRWSRLSPLAGPSDRPEEVL